MWIVLGGSNGSGNLGDAVMWEALVHELRRHAPGSLVVTDGRPTWQSPIDHVEVLDVVDRIFLRWRSRPHGRLGARARALANRTSPGDWTRLQDEFVKGQSRGDLAQAWLKALDECEGLIISGAGGITDQFAHHAILGWGALLRRAQTLGKPTALFGQGIGPLVSPALRHATKAMLDGTDIVTTRNTESSRLLHELGVEGPTIQATPDWAILAQCRRVRLPDVGELIEKGRLPYFALCLHRYRPHSSRRGDHLSPVVELVESVLQRDMDVVLVPNRVGDLAGKADDRAFLAAFSRRVRVPVGRAQLRTVNAKVTAADVASILRHAHGLVTTRYHPMVFALAEGTPSWGIWTDEYYRMKFAGALEWYDRKAWMSNPDDISLRQFVDNVLENPASLRRNLDQRTQQLQGIVQLSFSTWWADRSTAAQHR
jgi:polysaccharide pyruvyl transferase WcaK-like protein